MNRKHLCSAADFEVGEGSGELRNPASFYKEEK